MCVYLVEGNSATRVAAARFPAQVLIQLVGLFVCFFVSLTRGGRFAPNLTCLVTRVGGEGGNVPIQHCWLFVDLTWVRRQSADTTLFAFFDLAWVGGNWQMRAQLPWPKRLLRV